DPSCPSYRGRAANQDATCGIDLVMRPEPSSYAVRSKQSGPSRTGLPEEFVQIDPELPARLARCRGQIGQLSFLAHAIKPTIAVPKREGRVDLGTRCRSAAAGAR